MTRRFLMGNEAFAHAALEAGCGLFAGYPGTPSSEVIETVAKLVADGAAKGVHVEWSTNEKAALEVAAAASLAGTRAMVTCKQVGLNVASDALMSLNYLGIKGGLVILVADDPGPISSQTEQDTRRFAAFAKVPVLDPATPEQGFAMIGQAFQLSERYGTPVIFRPTTRIDHASTFIDTADQTQARPPMGGGFQRDPEEYVIFPPRAYQAHGQINDRLRSISHDFRFDQQLAAFNSLFANAQGEPRLVTETVTVQAPAEEKEMAKAVAAAQKAAEAESDAARAVATEPEARSADEQAVEPELAHELEPDTPLASERAEAVSFGEYDELAESDYFDMQLLPNEGRRFQIRSERFSFPRLRGSESEKSYAPASVKSAGSQGSGTFYPLHNLADESPADAGRSEPVAAVVAEPVQELAEEPHSEKLPEREAPPARSQREKTVQTTRTSTVDPETGAFRSVIFADDDTDPRLPFARLGIVCGGVSTQYAREALRLLERAAERMGRQLPPLRLLQIGTPYPFPRRTAVRALRDLTDVLVLEELDSVIEEELQRLASASFLWPRVHGKLSGEANTRGENSTEDAITRIAAFLDAYAPAEKGAPLSQVAAAVLNPNGVFQYPASLPARPAVLCAGCPHRASFLAVKRALKSLDIKRDDAVFCGDIGCYTLGNAAPLDAVDTCLCMGGGITMAQGIVAADPAKKAIAFVGDSTFFASGMTGIVNAAYNQHDVTICILDNATTAMTGLQPHPGTGLTLMGEKSKPVSIKAVLKAANIQHVVEADPLEPERAEELVAEALAFEGPSAIIFKSPCIWTKPFGIPAFVNPNKCTGCRRCVTQVGCPAIGFDLMARGTKSGRRGQAVIDRTQCNGCGLCLGTCPTGAIDITPDVGPAFSGVKVVQEESKPEQEQTENPIHGEDAPVEAASVEGVLAEGLDAKPEDSEAVPIEEDAVSSEEVRGEAFAGATLATERLNRIRSGVPIIPMSPFGPGDEDDDLYADMTTRRSRAREQAAGPVRVIRPQGERHYFMKEAMQRGAAARMFAHTSSGQASQQAQLALTGSVYFAGSQNRHGSDAAGADDARPNEAGAGEEAARRSARSAPDYGGNSELSLDALFAEEQGAAPFTFEEAEALSQSAVPVAKNASAQDGGVSDVAEDGFAFSFDGVPLEMDEAPVQELRGHGRRSSTRNLKHVAAGKPPSQTVGEKDAEAAVPESSNGDDESTAAQPQRERPRQIRSRFADYGRSSQGSSPSPGAQNPWGGGRR